VADHSDSYATEIEIDAPPEVVYRHLTQPDALTHWMGEHATLEPVPGGRFEVDIAGTPVRGHYLEANPSRVVVTWGIAGSDDLPPGSTELEFTLEPIGARTRVHLVHRNLPDPHAQRHARGWQHYLPRLAIAAAGGDPGPDSWATATA
jgi:uncharacterized protein YndB with AHSA1/START domain